MMLRRFGLICLVGLFLQACTSSIYWRQQIPQVAASETARTFVIFFDGTHNDATTDTNVKRLHALVSLQNQANVSTLYVEGVGTGNDYILGGGTGVGFESRVVLAYNYLRTHFRSRFKSSDGTWVEDKIYVFGFSRGAWQARALASMLEYVGLPDEPSVAPLFEDQIDHSRKLYEEMKEGFQRRRFPCTIAAARSPTQAGGFKSRAIEFMGLWDTVGTLGGGVPNFPTQWMDILGFAAYDVNIDEPNRRYGDQLHNVARVYHAASIDDDREWAFTPLLVSREHLFVPKRLPDMTELRTRLGADCPAGTPDDLNADARSPDRAELDRRQHLINEVWFSGAHSDVGGGYADSDLSGVSLNWMLEAIKHQKPLACRDEEPSARHAALGRPGSAACSTPSDGAAKSSGTTKLVPEHARVREDIYGSSHDPETGIFHPIYHRLNRNLAAYVLGSQRACAMGMRSEACGVGLSREPIASYQDTLCVHPSVLARRRVMAPLPHENNDLALTETGLVFVETVAALPEKNPPRLRQVPNPSKRSATIRIKQWHEASQTCVD